MIDKKKSFFIITTVSDSLPFFKGQIFVLKEFFDIELVSSPGIFLEQMSASHDVKGNAIPMKREISLWNDLISLFRLIFLFLKKRPEVVHGNTPKASLLSMIAAWITFVPVRIYYVHGLRYSGEFGNKKRMLMAMEKISCFFATDVIAVSQGVKEALVTDRICKKEINLIWNGSINGIDLNYFDSKIPTLKSIRSNYGIKEDDFVYGFVGRLVGDKGINELVAAFKEVNLKNSNVKLLLVGSYENSLDPLEEETLEEINKNPNIITAGFQSDVRPFFMTMNIFTFPSYREGLCLVLMEAGAMNVPSISSDIVGCKEVIGDGINGILVESRNTKDLEEKMQLCISEPTKIKEMALLSRDFVKNKFEQKELWQKTLEKYKEIVNS
ncbi:glycosyltransferase family 4 protein [Flavobacterium sp. P4023]|uniref:Glycosyltransferase family 4 protein n=1 Tax=Flavobacterium flabelliforme TaxID=2816119 RepID=A0ABS5CSD5_9FLAO|nr:glycosyltransferase family 4 protein [Flavobacterium flabelliforme]MBP4141516.1 glycosyltransferase family 4 protein [Flavobacterium flabelliforme]